MPNLASQMRVAFASMVSNTGSSSPGELRNDAEHLRGRGLLLQRLAQIVGALAQLVEQPRVLDRDDGLLGKVLHQLDLLVGERAHLLPVNADRADQLVLLEHRDDDIGPGAGKSDDWRIRAFFGQVGNMDDLPGVSDPVDWG